MGFLDAFKNIDIFGATIGPQRTFNSFPGAMLTLLLYIVMALRFWQDASDTYTLANATITSFDMHSLGEATDEPIDWKKAKMYAAFGLYNTETHKYEQINEKYAKYEATLFATDMTKEGQGNKSTAIKT